MKIGVVQTRPVKGDIAANLADHQRWASLAVERGVGLLVFPELSITGYTCADLFRQSTLLTSAQDGLSVLVRSTRTFARMP